MECTCHPTLLCMHSFSLPQTVRQAVLENKTGDSLYARLCQVFTGAGWKKRGKKDPQEKITTLNALLAYVQESTCMCLTIFPSHLPCQLHSSSFIGTVKVKTCVPNTCKTTQLRYKQTNTRARVVDSGFTVNQISDWKQKTVNI